MDTRSTDPIAEELADLRARLDAAERRLAELDAAPTERRDEPIEPRASAAPTEPTEPTAESTTDRRSALRPAGLAAGAAVAGERTHLLDQCQRLWSGQFDDHRSQHVAEQADVTAEQVVVGHRGAFSWSREG
jgi:hypothetical protein